MPPLPALHIKALDDLVTQLRFAPPEAARRQLERAEELFGVIEPDQTYPEDWIVFAITGYRPEITSPALVVGGALRSELGILAERLSDAAELTEADLPGLTDSPPRWLDAPALCERWRISRKTLDRYRRRGLLARRVRGASGRDRLYFAVRFVDDFAARHAGLLGEAAAFTRLDPALEARILRRAARYRRLLGWSLNQAAERLAGRFGRGHETIRQLLRRHDAAAAEGPAGATPIFGEGGALSERDRRVVVRAAARGVEIDAIARRYRRTRASVYRVLARERADVLRSLVLVGSDAPDLARRDVPRRGASSLEAQSVTHGLGRPAPASIGELLRQAENDPHPDPRAERDRAAAYWLLRSDAARLIAALPRHNPGASACDEIETRLRWASRLKAELVRSQQSGILKTIRAVLGRDLTALARRDADLVLAACYDAVIEAADRFDPTKGGRLAAPVGLALNRALAKLARVPASVPVAVSRASPLVDPLATPIPDWTRRVDPWQARLEPDNRVRMALPLVVADARSFLAERFGWAIDVAGAPIAGGTGPPRTITQLARARGLTPHHASAFEREAIARALRAARQGGQGGAA